jgi:hypothetical protein
MDGQVMTDALLVDFINNNPIQFVESSWESAHDDSGISAEEEAMMAERLKRLGYL